MTSDRPAIDPALGLDLVATRTLSSGASSVSVVIPAHNEEATIVEVVGDCKRGLEALQVDGEVIVSASGCSDSTAELAESAGAQVVTSALGKGAAILDGIAASHGDVVCLIDGDIQYFGNPPLVTILVDPILRGVSDATIANLYWRPLYPQMWLHAFFTPLASYLFPELLTKAGATPWSGQRAARRHLWPTVVPNDFTVDLAILLDWNLNAVRFHPIVTDDWVNPQRPKVDLMANELELMLEVAQKNNRIDPRALPLLRRWYEGAHNLMAEYRPDVDDPQDFERRLLLDSLRELHSVMADLSTPHVANG